MFQASSKVLALPQLLQAIARRRAAGERMVFTNGCFDLLHWGHVRYLEAARNKADFLVIGLNSDSSVEGLKGTTRPLFSQKHRAELLAGLACVDYVTVFCEPTAQELVATLRPDVFVKGGDYKDPHSLPEAQVVLAAGGELKLLPGDTEISTSRIMEAIVNGEGRL